jgi:mRNA-degrading endonuclease toxin of MazEF toxin-antitoxin module
MNQWDIYTHPFREGDHPAIILSPDEICKNPAFRDVNVLLGVTCRPIARPPKRYEVMLDESDGLDWKTAVRCDQLVLVPKEKIRQHRGSVSQIRRREIARKIVEVFRLPIT